MQSLNKNGSYLQRRKMYIQFPLHNMRSKIPIDWSLDDRNTHERNRIKSKEINEKEYIKKIYDQKMERKLQERYNSTLDNYQPIPNDSLIDSGKDILAQELEQFNTSKVIPTSPARNNPEYIDQTLPNNYNPNKDIPLQSGQSESRYRQEERYRSQRESNPNERQISHNDRERKYSDRSRNYSDRNDRDRYSNDRERVYNDNSYNMDRERSYKQRNEQDRYNNDRQSHNQRQMNQPYPSLERDGSYQSENYLSKDSNSQYRAPAPPYALSPQNYKDPYLAQNQYSYNLMKYRKYAQNSQGNQSENHPFRNNIPDRLEQFLREKSKADRKKVINIKLTNK